MGASAHMTPHADSVDSITPYNGNDTNVVANSSTIPITHVGSYRKNDSIKLLNVLVVPHLTKNLLSISKLTSDFAVDVLFFDKLFIIQNRVWLTTSVVMGCILWNKGSLPYLLLTYCFINDLF